MKTNKPFFEPLRAFVTKCACGDNPVRASQGSHFWSFSQWASTLYSLSTSETKIAEFANSIDLDEVAHNEPPHLDLHCMPSRL